MTSFALVWAPRVGIPSTLTKSDCHFNCSVRYTCKWEPGQSASSRWNTALVNVLSIPTEGAQTSSKLFMGFEWIDKSRRLFIYQNKDCGFILRYWYFSRKRKFVKIRPSLCMYYKGCDQSEGLITNTSKYKIWTPGQNQQSTDMYTTLKTQYVTAVKVFKLSGVHCLSKY